MTPLGPLICKPKLRRLPDEAIFHHTICFLVILICWIWLQKPIMKILYWKAFPGNHLKKMFWLANQRTQRGQYWIFSSEKMTNNIAILQILSNSRDKYIISIPTSSCRWLWPRWPDGEIHEIGGTFKLDPFSALKISSTLEAVTSYVYYLLRESVWTWKVVGMASLRWITGWS